MVVLSCLVFFFFFSCPVLFCLVLSCPILYGLVVSCLVWSVFFFLSLVLSCLVLSCLIWLVLWLSCLVLWLFYLSCGCLVLSCINLISHPPDLWFWYEPSHAFQPSQHDDEYDRSSRNAGIPCSRIDHDCHCKLVLSCCAFACSRLSLVVLFYLDSVIAVKYT